VAHRIFHLLAPLALVAVGQAGSVRVRVRVRRPSRPGGWGS